MENNLINSIPCMFYWTLVLIFLIVLINRAAPIVKAWVDNHHQRKMKQLSFNHEKDWLQNKNEEQSLKAQERIDHQEQEISKIKKRDF